MPKEKAILRQKQENGFRRWFSEIKQKAKVELVSPELKANDYRFKGLVPQAIEEYKKAIAQDPTNPYLHITLAETYMSVKQSGLAFAEYENALRIDGGNADLYIIYGRALEAAGQKNLALEQYEKATLVAGDNKALHEKLKKTFEQMKKPAAVAREKAELARLAKKEAFEKQLTK